MNDFDSKEAAYKASETLIEEFYARHPEMLEKHPKKVYEGQPLLDQFWFAEFKGIWGAGGGGWGLVRMGGDGVRLGWVRRVEGRVGGSGAQARGGAGRVRKCMKNR